MLLHVTHSNLKAYFMELRLDRHMTIERCAAPRLERSSAALQPHLEAQRCGRLVLSPQRRQQRQPRLRKLRTHRA